MSDKITEQRHAFDYAREDYQRRTKSVSDLIKLIGFGLLASYYTIRGEVSELSNDDIARVLHTCVGIAAVLTILFEYLHNLFSARVALEALNEPVRNYSFNTKSFPYKAGRAFYHSKQVFAAVGALLLVYLILYL